jgi:non-specific serine/threonine protein kinase
LIAWRANDTETMAEALGNAIAAFSSANDVNGVGFCNLLLATHVETTDSTDSAITLLESAFVAHTSGQLEWGRATARYLIGEMSRAAGDLDRAVLNLRTALDIFLGELDAFGVGACASSLAAIAASQNDTTRAARLLGAAEALSESTRVQLPPVIEMPHATLKAQLAKRVPAHVFQAGRLLGIQHTWAEAVALADDIRAGQGRRTPLDPLAKLLTDDQREAVDLRCEGLSVDEIARALDRDRNTIYDRLHRARVRLNVRTNEELVARVSQMRSGAHLQEM